MRFITYDDAEFDVALLDDFDDVAVVAYFVVIDYGSDVTIMILQFVDEIVFIESFGRNIDVHTDKEKYRAAERMYVLEEALAGKGFIRVSNSCIVARSKIRKIKPSISMKYVLEMTDKSLVDVTRGYYYSFRERLGI